VAFANFELISPFLSRLGSFLDDLKGVFQGNFIEVRNLDLKPVPMLLFHGLELEIMEIKGENWGN